MSRGDKRERDRAKNLAKQAKNSKSQAKEGTPQQRNLNDSNALAEKIAKKQAMRKEQEEADKNQSKGPVPMKKKKQKEDGLDDLLSAGLSGGKKKK